MGASACTVGALVPDNAGPENNKIIGLFFTLINSLSDQRLGRVEFELGVPLWFLPISFLI